MSEPSNIQEPPDGGSDQRLVGRVPLFICKHCGHEWDDGSRYYCGCGGPYRIPNHDLSDSPNSVIRCYSDDSTKTTTIQTTI